MGRCSALPGGRFQRVISRRVDQLVCMTTLALKRTPKHAVATSHATRNLRNKGTSFSHASRVVRAIRLRGM